MRRLRQLLLPRDSSSHADHSLRTQRNRRAVMTGAAATVARIVQVGTSLITVPLTLKYLGNERFGLWMTISSVLAMATFADFGIGNGVLNTVTKAFGKDDVVGIRKAVSSGFVLLSSIATILLLTFFSIYRFFNWADFFRVSSPLARTEAGPALAVFATCFAVNVSLDVVQRVQLGVQQGYRFGLWQLLGSLAGLMGVLGGIWLHVGLPVLVGAIAGAPIIATALNAIHFFCFVRPDLRPARRLIAPDVISQITKLGGLFFVLQLATAVSYSSDNIVLTRILGPLAVAQYAVPCKLFSIVAIVSSFIVMPLWPAYGEALERQDLSWIRKTLFNSLVLVGGVSIFLSSVLVLFGQRIIHIWVGRNVHPSSFLLLALGISSVLSAVGGTIAMLLNGLSIVRFQVIIAIVGSIANITISICLTRRIGIPGVVYGTILSQFFIGLIPYAWFISRYFKKKSTDNSPTDWKSADVVGCDAKF